MIPCGATRKNCLIVSIQDFKDSIQAHKDLQSLKSREEFFVFVCAVYKLGLAYEELSSETGCTEQGKEILRMSMSMYKHYCHFSGMIILDDGIILFRKQKENRKFRTILNDNSNHQLQNKFVEF